MLIGLIYVSKKVTDDYTRFGEHVFIEPYETSKDVHPMYPPKAKKRLIINSIINCLQDCHVINCQELIGIEMSCRHQFETNTG